MEKTIKLSDGSLAKVKDVMIDLDEATLEKGIDVYINDEYKGSMIGEYAESVTAREIELQIPV